MKNFTDLGLSQPLVDTILDLGFENPTPIQSQAIPHLLDKQTDLVGLAQTGTGKTAAFGLPLVERVDTGQSHIQALVLAPTRELCLQITNEFGLFSKHLPHLRITPVYGGADIQGQIKSLRRGVHIVVATPGRLRDLIRRKCIQLGNVDFVVLDEADEMLNMGFKEELDDILTYTPEEKLTWLFSATMPKEVRRISLQYMLDPVELSVKGTQVANADIDHQYVKVYPAQRFEELKRFLDYDPSTFGLVFCRTRKDSKDLAEALQRDGYNADALHGDLNQSQRDRVMGRFRNRQLQLLVATDVAARGIDVQDITHVFHFNIPDDLAFYTHRSGRTGRAGKKGISLVLAHPNDMGLLQRLERTIKVKFTEAKIPAGKDICEKQLRNYLQKILHTEPHQDLQDFLPEMTAELQELSKDELIQRVASLSFSRFFEKYRHAPDLNAVRGRKKRHSAANMQRYGVNLGFFDLEHKGQLLSFICKKTGVPGSAIGKIDMRRTHSSFDVDSSMSPQVEKGFEGLSLNGRSIYLNAENGKANGATKKSKKKRRHRKK
ncbi:MAG: DEAD/DEAH box helicase [Bacteroidetes bacterium]|nr:MAG: DEAD/DEAH box helicase [Bacteroidota bacterium]